MTDTEPGDNAAELMMALHGLVMNGGLHRALELTESRPALISALQLLALEDLVRIVSVVEEMDEDEADDVYDAVIPSDAAWEAALDAAAERSPGLFSPPGRE